MSKIRKRIDTYAQKNAKQIARQLDESDGKDNIIKAKTWRKYAVKKFGAKDNVSVFIDVSSAEKSIAYYITRESTKVGENAADIGSRWQQELDLEMNPQKQDTSIEYSIDGENKDALYKVESEKVNIRAKASEKAFSTDIQKPVIAEENTINEPKNLNLAKQVEKNKIIHNMYSKWSAKYKNSNLDIGFYNRLYDFLEQINCEVDEKNFDSDNYSSKKEQTMDEVIAILAGESSLNSKAKHYTYRGIFQLDADSLKTVKSMAKKNNIKGINQNITISQFWNLSGEKQLDYLVGHVAYGKQCSGLDKDEKISPGQLWAIIKKPKCGQKNSTLVQQKSRAIDKIFNNNKIERGVA